MRGNTTRNLRDICMRCRQQDLAGDDIRPSRCFLSLVLKLQAFYKGQRSWNEEELSATVIKLCIRLFLPL